MKQNEITDHEAFISEAEALSFRVLLVKNWKSYRAKPESMTNHQWLQEMFQQELSHIPLGELEDTAKEVMDSLQMYDENLNSIHAAAEKGESKESWLAKKLEESSTGYSVQQFGEVLQGLDDNLYAQNVTFAEALARSTDGNIKMSPNLDGNIAEHTIASSANLSAAVQGKNIIVEVRDVFTSNSVDVRATNLSTGAYQNYQLKFGKDANATIELAKRGNYGNQRLIVPREQVEEVQAYFKSIGSQKTVTDHIEIDGVKSKSFTKEEMKQLQNQAQETNQAPTMDYNLYHNKELARSIGKNAAVMGIQTAAVTAGFMIAEKVWKNVSKGEKFETDEVIETALHTGAVALRTGADASVKTVVAGTLQVAVRKGMFKKLPLSPSAAVITNVASIAVENVKIASKVAKGELSVTKALDHMGRNSTASVAGLVAMKEGALAGSALGSVGGPAVAVVTGFVGGSLAYIGGSQMGESVYEASVKIGSVAKSMAKSVVSGLKSTARTVTSGVKSTGRAITSLLGL